MSVSINTNTSATFASQNLSKSNALLQKSLQRLSSGSKIANAADDAGGLAVSLRMEAALRRTAATTSNVGNAISFLQTQDGSLANVATILTRMSELKTLALDATKSSGDLNNYATEFAALQAEYSKTVSETFNGISLFDNDATRASNANSTSLTITLSEDASQTMLINQSALYSNALTAVVSATVTDYNGLTALAVSTITTAISEIATDRATNGAQTSRLQFALDSLASNATNLEAANSRIIDVDVASETTRLARNNILVQAGTAMLSQANASSQIALKLLQ